MGVYGILKHCNVVFLHRSSPGGVSTVPVLSVPPVRQPDSQAVARAGGSREWPGCRKTKARVSALAQQTHHTAVPNGKVNVKHRRAQVKSLSFQQ